MSLEPPFKKLMTSFRDAFNHFDKHTTGTIRTSDVHSAVKSLGQNPTDGEVQNLLNNYNHSQNNRIEFKTFSRIMMEIVSKTNPEEDIFQAFSVFNETSVGYIDGNEIKNIMTCHMRNPLTDDEANEILESVVFDEYGHINYKEFERLMKSEW